MVMMKVQHFLWVSNIYSVRPKTLAMYPKATSPSICMLVATKVRVLSQSPQIRGNGPKHKSKYKNFPGLRPWTLVFCFGFQSAKRRRSAHAPMRRRASARIGTKILSIVWSPLSLFTGHLINYAQTH